MLFIQYPPCSTCQKAKKWLDAQGISYEDRHIKENNPSFEELKSWYEISGLLYKSMGLKDRLPAILGKIGKDGLL